MPISVGYYLRFRKKFQYKKGKLGLFIQSEQLLLRQPPNVKPSIWLIRSSMLLVGLTIGIVTCGIRHSATEDLEIISITITRREQNLQLLHHSLKFLSATSILMLPKKFPMRRDRQNNSLK